MNRSKLAIAGISVIAGAGILIAASPFQSKNGEKNKPGKGKYKQYQVIHMQDGKLIEADTLIPMSSNYSVESFLKDKNIDSEDLDIIKIPNEGEMEDLFFIDASNKGKGEKKMVFHTEIKKDGEFEEGADVDIEDVQIMITMDDNGEMKGKKIVNGKEVELTKEELEKIHEEHANHAKAHGGKKQVDVKIDKDDDDHDFDGEDKEVEMIIKIDDNGNVKGTKMVDGKEVELTPEELEEMKKEHHKLMKSHGDQHMMIKIDMDDEDLKEFHEKIMKKVHLELGDIDFDFDIDGILNKDSLMNVIHEELKGMHDELGEMKVIIKEMDENIMIDKNGNSVMIDIDAEMDADENFTIVIVREGIDKDDTETSNSITDPDMDFKVFPNPTEGKFTASFLLDKKAKTNLEVVDLNGKKIYSEDLGKIDGRIQKEIDLSQFKPGVYILNVYAGKERLSKRVVKK